MVNVLYLQESMLCLIEFSKASNLQHILLAAHAKSTKMQS